MQPPATALAKRLDEQLQSLNGDYAAKRVAGLALQFPKVSVMPSGTFDAWLQSKNRLGGQHKVPRLTNQTADLDRIVELADQELSPTC